MLCCDGSSLAIDWTRWKSLIPKVDTIKCLKDSSVLTCCPLGHLLLHGVSVNVHINQSSYQILRFETVVWGGTAQICEFPKKKSPLRRTTVALSLHLFWLVFRRGPGWSTGHSDSLLGNLLIKQIFFWNLVPNWARPKGKVMVVVGQCSWYNMHY